MSTPYLLYNDFGMRGNRLYAVLDDPNSGQTWNGTGFADSPARSLAAVALTEYQTGRFRAAVPAGINSPRLLLATVYLQAGGAGGSPNDAADTDVGSGLLAWGGSAFVLPTDPVKVAAGGLNSIIMTTAGHTFPQFFSFVGAALAGVESGDEAAPGYLEVGAASGTPVISATVDSNNRRSQVTLTPPSL